MTKKKKLSVAYFTMEIGLKAEMPTYAGGLGMLAADIMWSACDIGVPGCCMTMCWQHGYMHQELNEDGTQEYSDIEWNKEDHLTRLDETVTVQLEGRDVTVGCWVYELKNGKNTLPVYFLDTDLPENSHEDRELTKRLYGGDGRTRISQEAVLGIGGVRMLRALGYDDIGTFHMNEGHAAFLTLERLRECDYQDDLVRASCAFTTHTPVPAGHDVFDYDLAYQVVGEDMIPWHIRDIAGQDRLSMTLLAMHLSRYTCGVAQIHGEVSRNMFPGEEIDAITNGVHHVHWACPEMTKLFDKYIKGWQKDPTLFEKVVDAIPDDELWKAHKKAKKRLIERVNSHGHEFKEDILTLCSARRVVPYKRPEVIYTNLERLAEVAGGRIQIIHSGNANPHDAFSQGVVQHMVQRSKDLRDKVSIAYIPNYNPDLAADLVSGTDIWLNTPMRLMEASGTSGMKATLNGALNLSILDGWWIEGYEMDHEAGWRIGPLDKAVDIDEYRKIDAEDFYTQLQFEILPEYYNKPDRWVKRMKRAIALMAFFSSQRCTEEYVERAWNV